MSNRLIDLFRNKEPYKEELLRAERRKREAEFWLFIMTVALLFNVGDGWGKSEGGWQWWRLAIYLSFVLYWSIWIISFLSCCERIKKYSKKIARIDKEIVEELSRLLKEKGIS